MTTMAGVAARAGVSTATVSRALNGKAVSAEVAEAVRRAAEELDYTIDRTARSLRRRYSDVLALVVPNVEDPFFTSVARGVEDVARAAGFSVVLCNSDDDPAKEARYVEIAAQEQMAGLILAPASSRPRLTPLQRKQRTIVVVDRAVDEDLDQVVFDNVALGRTATEQLLEQGFERIACITGPQEINTAAERARGWRLAIEAAGHAAPAELLRYANYRVDGGRSYMHDLMSLPDPPDAVVAANSMVGIGVLQALSGRSTQDRPHVSIIGEVPFVTSDVPGATALPLGPREMGTRAAQMFVERHEGRADAPRLLTMETGTPQPLTGVLKGHESR